MLAFSYGENRREGVRAANAALPGNAGPSAALFLPAAAAGHPGAGFGGEAMPSAGGSESSRQLFSDAFGAAVPKADDPLESSSSGASM